MTYEQAKADNWTGGGASGSAPTYAVGGSVSGLSGTVVLQDNGGDDLSVSANGAFSFATKLAGGAAYSVTVKTNPSGQSCSVANGSGTIAAADVTNIALTCGGSGSGGSDDFNRPNGSLGSNWVAISDGALSIASQAVVGTSATAGDIRIAETYRSDQSSQIELTSTQLSGDQWVGPACAPRTAARRPTSGSTTGTTATRSSGSTSAAPALDSARQLLQLGAAGRRDEAAAERRSARRSPSCRTASPVSPSPTRASAAARPGS